MTASLSMRAALQQVAAEAEELLAWADEWFSDAEDAKVVRDHAHLIRVTALAQINALNEAEHFDRAITDSPRNEHGEPTYARYRLIPDPKESE